MGKPKVSEGVKRVVKKAFKPIKGEVDFIKEKEKLNKILENESIDNETKRSILSLFRKIYTNHPNKIDEFYEIVNTITKNTSIITRNTLII